MSNEVDQSKQVLLPNPLKWLWRNPFKTVAALAFLLVALWHLEDRRGKRDLVKQRALREAEFGEISIESFEVEEIPNDENFFAAPVFDSMAGGSAREGLPNAKFLKLSIPSVGSLPVDIVRLPASGGISFLDLEPAARQLELTGVARPEGVSSAQWLHSEMPADATIDGLRDALSRPKAMQIPTSVSCWKYGIASGDLAQIPIPTISAITPLIRELSTRASLAARAGDGAAAAELCEVNLRLIEGLGTSRQLIGSFVAIAIGRMCLPAISEALQCRCWSDAYFLGFSCASIPRRNTKRSILSRQEDRSNSGAGW